MSTVIGILLVLFLILDLVLVIVAIIVLLKEDHQGDYKRCKCSECEHEFTYDDRDIVNFEYSGKRCRVVECPRCKNYAKI